MPRAPVHTELTCLTDRATTRGAAASDNLPQAVRSVAAPPELGGDIPLVTHVLETGALTCHTQHQSHCFTWKCKTDLYDDEIS